MNSNDIIYYNLTLASASPKTSGLPYDNNFELSSGTINNNIPIVDNPDDYYCSIIRLEFSGYSLPLVQFCVQTPVTDINKGIYSFTLSYGATSSAQTFYIFVPPDLSVLPPQAGTPTQTFGQYYNIYDYSGIVNMMNTALETAFNDLVTATGGGSSPIITAKVPFFYYNPDTGRIELYTDKLFFDKSLPTPIKIYWNAPSYIYLVAFAVETVSYNDPNGKDNLIVIDSANGLNDKIITTGGPTYIKTQQQYISLEYMSSLKSILVLTTMSINTEAYNINVPKSQQNVGYQGIMTDFLPDISQPIPGIIGYKFIYNAPSLYRCFEFNQKTPLYTINAALFYTDIYGNSFPLTVPKGQLAEIKFMFIKKTIFNKFLL